MPTLSTGALFFIGGIAGLVLVPTAALIIHHSLKRAEKRLRDRIWSEYR